METERVDSDGPATGLALSLRYCEFLKRAHPHRESPDRGLLCRQHPSWAGSTEPGRGGARSRTLCISGPRLTDALSVCL